MQIYLDANVLKSVRSFTEPPWLALLAVAHTLDAEIVVPSLVVDEAAAELRRELRSAHDQHYEAARRLEHVFGLQDEPPAAVPDPTPDAAAVRERWLERLKAVTTIVDTTAEHAWEGLQREVWREPPAGTDDKKPGSGARDAAIWATIRDHLKQTNGPAYVVTGDKAFAGFSKSGGALRPELAAEIGSARLDVKTGLQDLVDIKAGQAVELDVRTFEARAARGLTERIEALGSVPGLVDTGVNPMVVGTAVAVGELTCESIVSAYDYGDGVRLIDSRWAGAIYLSYDADDERRAQFTEPFSIRVRAQFFENPDAPERPPATLDLTVTSPTTLYGRMADDGVEWTWRSLTIG